MFESNVFKVLFSKKNFLLLGFLMLWGGWCKKFDSVMVGED